MKSWPGVRVEHVAFSGVGDAAEVGALIAARVERSATRTRRGESASSLIF
jgi:hypothetical protein